MKPFLLLSTRAEHDAAREEWEAIIKHSRLMNYEVIQYRLESAPLPDIELTDYAGVFLGGGPFNASDPDKSEVQRRAEADISRVLDEAIARGIPFLGLCYGVGVLVQHFGGRVDRLHGEEPGMVPAELTPEGRADPLFEGLPQQINVFVGHKEACSELPPGATLLAAGGACPIQAFKVGSTVYAIQFHPELDSPGMAARIRIYRDAGYFAPEEMESLVAMAQASQISPEVHAIFTNFVRLCRE